MDQWYILYDIPYQKDFVGYYELQAIDDGQWYILNDIPYQKKFKALADITEHPVHDGMWKILTDIPYQSDFVTYYALQPLPDLVWYILTDIPYKKEFPQLPEITNHPLHEGMWNILTDIPYQKDFPPYQELQPFDVSTWYILNDIPYQKDFPVLKGITATPSHPDKWHILTDIPYQPQFPTYYELQSWRDDWYILTDIPYRKEFPELFTIDETPKHSGQWYISFDIPYQKPFVAYYTVQPLPEQWYILNDIPYKKEFPQQHAIDETPQHPGQWYILSDIPYQKLFRAYYTLQPLNELWYILLDIPYKKEFPKRYDIDAVPKHYGWYILYDIPYRKEFPPLYGIDAIPKHYIPKYYMVVGVGAIGRWQVRKCRDDDTENWQLIEDLGPPSAVLSACIEADGDFDYIAGNDSITLTTTDTPWMAVITTTKKLYVKQVCADITTAILLDTGVEQASLCRGWKSDKYSVDSGLICAYRKSNGVYAKVYKKVNGEYVWETLPQLLYEPVDHVEVKRLNDYRIGVYVTNPNRLLLSERFYIGGTSKTEYISVKLKPWANVCSFSMVGEPAEQTFKVERCWMEEDTKVRMHCNYPIVSFDPTYPNLTLTDDYNYSKLVEYYIQNGDLVCILDKPKYSNFNTIRIVIPNINHILYQITPQFKRTIPGGEYAVENPPIAEYISVHVTASAGILRTTEKMNYKLNYDTEHVVASVVASAGILRTTKMGSITNDYDSEHITVNLVATAGVFTTTQSGDMPI